MDDDASTHMECIKRSACILSWVDDDRLAISGSMLQEEHPHILHEVGAIIRKPLGIRPLFSGMDAANLDNLVWLETGDPDYGAWWFFAFPLKHTSHLAFPFFVRGDDIQFSRANGFRTITMNGIACWQQKFDDKINPGTEYLAQRSEFLIGLLANDTPIGWFWLAIRAVRNAQREASGLRYGHANARLDAIRDVLCGPDFFEREPSAVRRLVEIRHLYVNEFASPIGRQLAGKVNIGKRKRVISRLFHFLTASWHFVPNRFLSSRPMVIPTLGCVLGFPPRQHLIYYSPHLQVGFHVEKSAYKYALILWRSLVLMVRISICGRKIQKEYEAKLEYLQSEQFWSQFLGNTSQDEGSK